MKKIPWFTWVLGAGITVAAYYYYKARMSPGTATVASEEEL